MNMLSRVVAAVAIAATLVAFSAARAEGLADADTRAPIEVTADRLTVDRARSLAVFEGEVEAKQGTLILRADRVRVFYREDAADDGQAVRRIEAEGHVRISSPTETASGEKAVYDLEAGTVVMEGDVVLTRGDNVVRGDRLVVDLTARTASVEATGTRVRALFRPEELRPQEGGAGGAAKEVKRKKKAGARGGGGKPAAPAQEGSDGSDAGNPAAGQKGAGRSGLLRPPAPARRHVRTGPADAAAVAGGPVPESAGVRA